MTIVDYIFKYNFIFRIYLIFIFFFNLLIFYFFGIRKIHVNQKINNINLLSDNKDLKYSLILKKILSVINNPIIFEYQLNQSNKINVTSNKFIEKYDSVNYIKNNLTKLSKSKKYYDKIHKLLSHNYPEYSDNKKIVILTKLLCINFK